MARRRPIPAERSDEMVMPLELTRYDRDEWPSVRDQSRARAVWLHARGIDPADWSAVYPILRASMRHHGIPDAVEHARLRLQPTSNE